MNFDGVSSGELLSRYEELLDNYNKMIIVMEQVNGEILKITRELINIEPALIERGLSLKQEIEEKE